MFKNIKLSEIKNLETEIVYQEQQVSSRTIVQNDHVSITLFSFDKDQEIGTHEARGDAMVNMLDGTARITIAGKDYIVKKGESIILPANVPHSLWAKEKFKMMLIIVYPS